MKIIINADDFGLSEEVNSAIAEAFRRGYITNTTVMANMPGFLEAVALSRENGFFDKVGIHLNFLEGEPLTEEMKKEPLFTEGGKMTSFNLFHKESKKNYFLLPRHTKKALRAEAEAQLARYCEAGFPELHLDSHGHSHTIYSIYQSIAPMIRKHGFKTVRLSLNFFAGGRSFLVRVYKWLINRILRRGKRTTVYFTSADEFVRRRKAGPCPNGVYEIMVHPVWEEGKLKNMGGPDFEELLQYIEKEDLISYLDI